MLKAFTGKASSGDAANSAIGLESGLVKSGYLVKRAKMSQSNWKKRYFVLNGHSLTYYKDIKQVGAAQGDLLLTDDTTCMAVQEANRGPCFDVNTPFSVLRMEAMDAKERDEWMQAIKNVVNELRVATRGYLWRKGTSMFATWSRKFFIVHEDSITCHEDHMKTSKIDVAVKLSEGAVTVEERPDCAFAIVRGGSDVLVLRAEEDSERAMWMGAVKKACGGGKDAAEGGAGGGGEGGGEADTKYVLQSALEVRSDKLRSNNWDLHYFTLNATTVKHFEDEKAFHENRPIETFRLSPQCCVFETNLAANAFELVTGKKVLHVAGASAKISEEWIRNLRRVITESQVTQGPLLDRVRERWGTSLDGSLTGPDFYTVVFQTKKPLGLVLERSSEWAIVKLSSHTVGAGSTTIPGTALASVDSKDAPSDTGVSVGSVLYTINGKAVTQQTYPETIKQLTGWQPPLALGFRHAPRQHGWLQKQSRGRNSSVKNWKARYFVLDGGRLSYYEDDKKGSEIKGDIQLMGSAVSLLSHAETGQFFCFRVVSGITAIVMQAKTVDEMMDWASVLYHSSSMANGGGYLLDVEKARLKIVAEAEAKEAALKRAEEEATQRKIAEEKAKAAAIEAAEAERKAKEEKEAALAAAAAASEEEKRKAEEAAAALEAAEIAAAAESARLKAEEEKARAESEQAAAEVAAQEKAAREEAEALKAQEEKAAQEAKIQEEARNRALEEEAKAEAAKVAAEEAELAAAAAAAPPEAPAEAGAAAAAAAEGAPTPQARGGRRPSVILNDLGDSEDEEDEVDIKASESGAPPPPAIPEDEPAPAAAAPEAAAAPAAAPAATAAADDSGAGARARAQTSTLETNRVEVSQNESEAVDGMLISDELLEQCFVNLNGGSPSGTLNPMQLSILVRLITKKHDLMQEMKWFSKFDSDGVGGVDLNEFKAGFRNIEDTGLVDGYTGAEIASAIKSYVAHSNFAL